MDIIYLYFEKRTKQNKPSDPDASNTGGVSKAPQYLLGTFDVQYMKYFALLVAKRGNVFAEGTA